MSRLRKTLYSFVEKRPELSRDPKVWRAMSRRLREDLKMLFPLVARADIRKLYDLKMEIAQQFDEVAEELESVIDRRNGQQKLFDAA